VTRGRTFGSVASTYERLRPGYPDQIVAEVAAYAERPIRNALEIGAGTGKATRLFAAHGISVTATEPDAAMLEELHKHVPESVTTVRASFEDLAPSMPFDLVYAAAALHWTTPERRWERIAALLAPHGVFACFGGPIRLSDPDLETAVRTARAPWVAVDDDILWPDGTPEGSPMQWPGTELAQSELFTDVRQSTIERRMSLSARDYISQLSTISAYLVLPEPDRRRAFEAIRRILPSTVTVSADLTLHLARLA